jgi:hypothetical protein
MNAERERRPDGTGAAFESANPRIDAVDYTEVLGAWQAFNGVLTKWELRSITDHQSLHAKREGA